MAVLSLSASKSRGEMPDDPVLRYYIDSVSSRLEENILFVDYIDITVDITAHYQRLNFRGDLDDADTAIFTVDLKNGEQGSKSVIDSASIDDNTIPNDLKFIKPW